MKLSTARQRQQFEDLAEVESGGVDFLTNMINEENTYAYCCEDITKIENYAEAVAD